MLIWKSTFGMALSVVPELKSVNDEDTTKSSEDRAENHPGTTTGTTTTSPTKQQHSNPEPCSWGELCHSSTSTSTTTTTPGTNRTQTLIPDKIQAREKTTITNSKDEPHIGGRVFDIKSEGNNNNMNDPYSTTSHEQQHQHHYPPAGYSVDARVYVHPHNSLAYFDRTLLPTLPYWDCASTGITTPPLPLQHAVIRYSLSASSSQTTTSSSSTNSSPLSSSVCLLIPLQQKPITLELSSGESKILLPGSVVWLDPNVPSSSYRFVSNHEEDMTILSLTLPRHTPLHPPVLMKGSGTAASSSSSSSWPFFNTHSKNRMQGGDNDEQASQCWMFVENEPSWRRRGITIVGVAMSILIADWMGRVAPIWLSLGIGGGCWVIGGTWGFVQVMEPLLDRLERKVRHWYQTIPQTLHPNEEDDSNRDMKVQQHPMDDAAEEESIGGGIIIG
jgi:hypothetical protein